MKKSQLEMLVREALEEGFFWDKLVPSLVPNPEIYRKHREQALIDRGFKRAPLRDPLALPGGEEIDKDTGKTYAELTAIWKANGGELDYRGRPKEIVYYIDIDGIRKEREQSIPIGSLSQKLRAARKV